MLQFLVFIGHKTAQNCHLVAETNIDFELAEFEVFCYYIAWLQGTEAEELRARAEREGCTAGGDDESSAQSHHRHSESNIPTVSFNTEEITKRNQFYTMRFIASRIY